MPVSSLLDGIVGRVKARVVVGTRGEVRRHHPCADGLRRIGCTAQTGRVQGARWPEASRRPTTEQRLRPAAIAEAGQALVRHPRLPADVLRRAVQLPGMER